ncbi:helix-turn-helix domain-containing protein [Sneathiella chinensis]|uniref:histidine kinase n=1 Tax=Sneathiella chinensis TaxID=349750 RepID=A0ABQ5U3Y2_9PROT|nr:short-chain fatty acyl-CoA regulator family protein [Sneathiella chinensis]GLQ06111.1 putative transcriptional regulator protein [Sneathiella chinensis]
MSKTSLAGGKIRLLRKEKGISQTELADQLGISSSYLNLIEHGRRSLTVPLLLRLSNILKVDPHLFAPQKDNQLIAEIREALQDPLFTHNPIEEDAITTLASDFPDAGRHLVTLYKAYKGAVKDLQFMTERLTQDSLLADSSFRLRTLVTSILSLTEIMHDNEDLKPEQRQEFLDIVLADSRSLTDTVNEMLGVFGGDLVQEQGFTPSPAEAATDFIQSSNNYFGELEDAATDLLRTLQPNAPPEIPDLTRHLETVFNVTIDYATRDRHATEISLFDDRSRHLILPRALPPSSVRFHLALLIGQLAHGDLFNTILDNSDLASGPAREKGAAALANYFAGACLLPYDLFLKAAEELRYDIEVLQQQFGASYEQICHRLTTLQKPGNSAIPFHLIRTDVAGNISKRFSASGLRIPRYGNACPRWVVHAALLTPGQIQTQISEMPDGHRFFAIARTVTKPSLGFAHPKRHYALSLGCDIAHAHRMVYADGITLTAPRTVMPVGISCGLCDRENCTHRAAPPPSRLVSGKPGSRNLSPGIGDL